MNNMKKAIEFYNLTNKLTDLVRTGHIKWNIQRDRLESVAEHIYSTCMLAISVASEADYEVDVTKIIKMLAVHETEEVIIGDITLVDGVSAEDKKSMGKKAVEELFAKLSNGSEYIELIDEFEAHDTAESKFSYYCDKLQCAMQVFQYDSEGVTDIHDDGVDEALKTNKHIIKMMNEEGAETLGDIFYKWYRPVFEGEIGKPFVDFLDCAYSMQETHVYLDGEYQPQ